MATAISRELPLPAIYRSLAAYIALLYRTIGWRLFGALLLLIVSGITEGIGLVMLIPILNTAARGPQAASPLPALPFMLRLFKVMHVPLSLAGLMGVALCLVLLRILLTRQREITMANLRLAFVAQLQNSLFQAAEQVRWEHWVRQRSSGFLHTLTSEVAAVGEGTYYFLHLCVTLVLALACLLVAMRVSLLLTAAVALTAAVLFWLLRGHLNSSYQLGQSIDRKNECLYAEINHFFNGLKFTKSHGEAARFTRTLMQTVAQVKAERLTFIRNQQTVRVTMEVSIAVLLFGCVYGAMVWLHLKAAEVILLVLIFARLMPMASRMFSQAQHVLHMLPAFRVTLDTLNACKAAAEPQLEAVPGLPALHEGVHFQKVRARYETDGKYALDGIDCVIPARQTTALVGPSGAGKTTFVDLLTGLLQPESGAIFVDGMPLRRFSPGAWGQQISYLPQEGFLVYGSIRENLTYLTPAPADGDLWTALRLAAADQFVRDLPAGLDTVIGDKGMTLSGGERQRLALARALLRKPDLLILDEATSALDGLNEQHIRMTLSALHGKTTIVLIAHRMATIRYADQIIVLENGKISGSGGWHELSGQGYFKELISAQALQSSLPAAGQDVPQYESVLCKTGQPATER